MNWQGADKTIAKPVVSVIIPVFNDSQRLQICLEALENQTYPANMYEVIVVDNGSDKAVEKIVGHFVQASVVVENRPGSYAARNKGVSSAKGEVIAFTDSDCIPKRDWIENGVVNLLHDFNCGLVAGRIELFFKNPEKLTTVEQYERLKAFPQKEYIDKKHFGVTANIFTLKSVFKKVGLFNENLKSNGDLEWGQRVFLFGYNQVYEKDSCVAHPARSSFRQLHQKIARVTKGGHTLCAERGLEPPLPIGRLFLRFLIPPLKTVLLVTMYDSRLGTLQAKLKFISVLFFVHYISHWENLSLRMFSKQKQKKCANK